MSKQDVITPFQLFSITLFSMLFGFNLYPSAIEHDIHYEWFIAQLISLALIFPVVLMLLGIFRNTNADSLENVLTKTLGNLPAKIFLLFFFLYFTFHSIRIILLESNDIQLFLFDKTPVAVIAAVIAIVAFFISYSGVNSLAKLTELLSVPILLFIIFIIAVFLSKCDFGETKALFQPNTNRIIQQVIKSVSCFSCIEAMLFFVCRTVNDKKRKYALISGYAICSLIILALTICVVGIFTLRAASSLIYPVTELARTVQLRYLRVIERFDSLILSVKIIHACVFVSISCFCASASLSALFKSSLFKYSIIVYIILIILIFIGSVDSFLKIISKILIYSDIVFLFMIIPLLFIISIAKKKGNAQCGLKE